MGDLGGGGGGGGWNNVGVLLICKIGEWDFFFFLFCLGVVVLRT